ncbi:MAG: hypothetical protein E7Z90_05850 [Cyanobacteria bacterium SIG29]|nr:hypothetical protein [Cyanobacteria bacterium SIG29]
MNLSIQSSYMYKPSFQGTSGDYKRIQKHYKRSIPLDTEVNELAKQFKNTVIEPYSDWTEDTIPADKEEGSFLLKLCIKPFLPVLEKYSPEQAEKFARMVFGEKQMEILTNASIKNSDIKALKDTIEERIGKNIDGIYV